MMKSATLSCLFSQGCHPLDWVCLEGGQKGVLTWYTGSTHASLRADNRHRERIDHAKRPKKYFWPSPVLERVLLCQTMDCYKQLSLSLRADYSCKPRSYGERKLSDRWTLSTIINASSAYYLSGFVWATCVIVPLRTLQANQHNIGSATITPSFLHRKKLCSSS